MLRLGKNAPTNTTKPKTIKGKIITLLLGNDGRGISHENIVDQLYKSGSERHSVEKVISKFLTAGVLEKTDPPLDSPVYVNSVSLPQRFASPGDSAVLNINDASLTKPGSYRPSSAGGMILHILNGKGVTRKQIVKTLIGRGVTETAANTKLTAMFHAGILTSSRQAVGGTSKDDGASGSIEDTIRQHISFLPGNNTVLRLSELELTSPSKVRADSIKSKIVSLLKEAGGELMREEIVAGLLNLGVNSSSASIAIIHLYRSGFLTVPTKRTSTSSDATTQPPTKRMRLDNQPSSPPPIKRVTSKA